MSYLLHKHDKLGAVWKTANLRQIGVRDGSVNQFMTFPLRPST
jgi:hypothetical protein